MFNFNCASLIILFVVMLLITVILVVSLLRFSGGRSGTPNTPNTPKAANDLKNNESVYKVNKYTPMPRNARLSVAGIKSKN